MKCFRRCSCVLLSCILLLVVSSVTVSAKSIETPHYTIIQAVDVMDNDGGWSDVDILEFDITNGIQEKGENTSTTLNKQSNYTFENTYQISTENMPLIPKGNSTNVTFYNAYYSYGLTGKTDGAFAYFRNVGTISVLVTYGDGSQEYITNATYIQNNAEITIEFTFTPTKEVAQLKYIITAPITTGYQDATLHRYLGEVVGVDSGYCLTFNQLSEESGFLSGILDGIKGLGDSIKDVFNSITELPSKIWEFIENGLKALFVPDDEYMVTYKEKFTTLLSDRLGAVWQVVDIISTSWDGIQNASRTRTIKMPVCTIPLPDGNSFTFGGDKVQVVPNGMQNIVDNLKSIIAIVCTFLFVNGLRKRYDEVMGVEK